MGPTARRIVAVARPVGGWRCSANRSLRRVRGASMVPTLRAGDLVLSLPVRRPTPWRGRAGARSAAPDPRPGQARDRPARRDVEVRDGTLLLDGRRHREAHQHGRGPDGRLRGPARHLAVLGDARDASTDSRSLRAVPLRPGRPAGAGGAVRPRLRWLRSDAHGAWGRLRARRPHAGAAPSRHRSRRSRRDQRPGHRDPRSTAAPSLDRCASRPAPRATNAAAARSRSSRVPCRRRQGPSARRRPRR